MKETWKEPEVAKQSTSTKTASTKKSSPVPVKENSGFKYTQVFHKSHSDVPFFNTTSSGI